LRRLLLGALLEHSVSRTNRGRHSSFSRLRLVASPRCRWRNTQNVYCVSFSHTFINFYARISILALALSPPCIVCMNAAGHTMTPHGSRSLPDREGTSKHRLRTHRALLHHHHHQRPSRQPSRGPPSSPSRPTFATRSAFQSTRFVLLINACSHSSAEVLRVHPRSV
jgi:hypothetical protein